MQKEYINLPDNIINEIETAYGKGRDSQAITFQEARKKFDEITGYGLKIYWLGRLDKLNPHNIKVFQWITENFVPMELQEKYPISNLYDVKFKGEDHSQLIDQTLDKLWENYKKIPNTGLLADPVKKFSLKRIFGK